VKFVGGGRHALYPCVIACNGKTLLLSTSQWNLDSATITFEIGSRAAINVHLQHPNKNVPCMLN
jgi:hypothetical protein